MRSVAGFFAVLVSCVFFCGCGSQDRESGRAGSAETLLVYVPCGMEMPFMALGRQFESDNPGVRVNLLLDNSNILAKRVTEKNERPDVMVSPGAIEMDSLLASGHIAPKDITHFGRYELVLFCPRSNPGDLATFADLATNGIETIAVADPETTSVGYYTRETLQNLGLWEKVKSKVVVTADPSMAYKHVARGKAQASFAYRSCPLKTAPEKLEYSKVRIVESVPREAYGPAYASIALLRDSPNRELGSSFVSMVMSAAGQAVLAKYEVPCMDRAADPGGQSGRRQ